MTESIPAEAHAAQMAERAARRRVDRYLDLLRCAHGDLAPLLRDAHTARMEDEKAEGAGPDEARDAADDAYLEILELHPGLREITFGLPADLDPATPGADMIRAAEHLRALALRLPEWAIHRAFCMLHRRATVTATAAGFELHQTLVGGDDVHEETTTTARDPRADATALLEVLGL
ncbi:hypothetical protein R4064_11090 [Micrococcus yunnanensis]|uniref:Uncharacterized protein n=2 Tax=Micrococcus yunnanensis TaxID=566027 RepID=A0AAP5T9N1_9MICC|nr:hypothetical protein [Micrococcus yunnanensis]MDV7178164.1 hypothetical protein [Micrococcus yunnanensis]